MSVIPLTWHRFVLTNLTLAADKLFCDLSLEQLIFPSRRNVNNGFHLIHSLMPVVFDL